jgi:hypothetical protein
MKTKIPELTFNKINQKNKGECGLNNKNEINIPLCLVVPLRFDHKICDNIISVPKEIDYKWFKEVANSIRSNHILQICDYDSYSEDIANTVLQYDWDSFSKNILRPNREHLKVVLKLDDDAVDRLFYDGYCFFNKFEEQPEDDGEYSNEEWEEMRLKGEVGYFCNFKNFLEHPNDLEY